MDLAVRSALQRAAKLDPNDDPLLRLTGRILGKRTTRCKPPFSTPDFISLSSDSSLSDRNAKGFKILANDKRKSGPVTDYGSSTVQWMRHRRGNRTKIEQERPSPSYIIDMIPPAARPDRPGDTIPCKHLHSSLNKIKHPINVVKWTPEGRRLLTGSSSGEFTLWNGMGFNFETIMSAHESAIRAVAWSHSDDWLVSADQEGMVKYWQPNFNNVKAIQAHDAAVRDLAFAPTDVKYVTGSDDSTLKIWDFSTGTEESTLTGHGWDVKAVDWHPSKGLLVSGSKDHLIKLWDPRTGRCLTNLHGHKNTIAKTVFEPTHGQLLATCARDQVARVFDIRMMRDVLLLRGHDKELTTLTWHPVHRSLLSTGSADGSIHHYLLDEPNLPEGTAPTISPYDSNDPANAPAQILFPTHRIPFAHETHVWSLAWHPLGHILASGSNDRVTRFWSRARPGETDCFNDRYHLGDTAAKAHGSWTSRGARQQAREEEEQELEDDAEALVDQKMPARPPTVPGLPGIAYAPGDGTGFVGGQAALPGLKGGPLQPAPQPQPPAAPSFSGMPPSLPAGVDLSNVPDISKLAELFGGNVPHPPPPPHVLRAGGAGQFVPPPPPPPGFPGFGNGAVPPPGMFPSGYPQANQGYNAQGNGYAVDANGYGGYNGYGGGYEGSANGNARKRAPLPSQQESLQEEMRRGNYKNAR